VAPLAVAPDGEVLTKYDGALPVVGSKQACDGSYLVVARTRPGSASRKHDLWSINLTTGTEVQITTDATDTFDFLNPVICGANCIYTKRRGEQVRRKAVALSGGAEADVFPSTELHMIGDSFATTDLMTQIVANLTNPNRFRSVDGLGGASLNSHYCRFHGGTVASDASTPDLGTIYPGTPIYWGDTLIIMDGGLTDLDPVVQVGNIIATATPAIKRVAYVEPGYNVGDGAIGSPGYTAWAAEKAAVQTAYPNIYCPTLAFMQSHGDGSANDNSDIANGWWPRSLRDGVIHPNTSGKAWLGLCIATFINSKGW
jgi:hypothetical protein